MKTIALLLICFLSILIPVFGQQIVQLRGTVSDEQTGTTLPGAHIIIKNKQIAAITDVNGQFRLPLNEVQPDDSIIISYIGYTPMGFSISDYLAHKDSLIRLKSSTTLLKEVTISSKKPDVMAMMKNIVKVYEKGKRKSPYLAKGYYCEKARIDNKYVMFAESIGYSVYNGMKMPHTGYSFFCENTRKSDSKENWKRYSRTSLNTTNREKLSDVTSSSSAALALFRLSENFGPLAEKYWEGFIYQLDSTFKANDQDYYGISFKKGSESGSIKVLAKTFQVKTIRYFSKSIFSTPLNKEVKGEGNVDLIYIKDIPFVNKVSLHYVVDNLEYWNEYNLLMQRFDHFLFNDKDYYSMIFYEMVPFVEYLPQNWEMFKISPDADYAAICEQLKAGSKTLEDQFQANSGKWWLSDFQKWFPNPDYNDPVGLEGQVKRARDLIGRLSEAF